VLRRHGAAVGRCRRARGLGAGHREVSGDAAAVAPERSSQAAAGRAVFPWPWPLLEHVRQWLGSCLAHFERASSHRLIEGLRSRFSWLDEYFVWKGTGVDFRCPVPRLALRFARQVSWFLDRLPGHVLMVREGPFVERITEGVSAAAIEAWIDETGRRPGSIVERALIRRWGAAGALVYSPRIAESVR